ncbi:MAG: hypothetical protein NXI10_14395 [bacterium]|nr:hypothetical protein [bacterium]
MKKIFTAAVMLICTTTAWGQVDCESYKTGKFVLRSPEYGDAYITRTRKYQKEKVTNPNTGEVTKLKDRIVWIDDCTYRLIPVKIDDPEGVVGDEILTFKIIETGEDYYVVKVTGLPGEPTVVRVDRL